MVAIAVSRTMLTKPISTAPPKIVPLEQWRVAETLRHRIELSRIDASDRCLVAMPLHSSAGIRRMLAVCSSGRILNPKSARSQVIGAMTMGVGAALTKPLARLEQSDRMPLERGDPRRLLEFDGNGLEELAQEEDAEGRRKIRQHERTDVVDADLSKYFDTIPHDELMLSIARRVVDRDMLGLIKQWLKGIA